MANKKFFASIWFIWFAIYILMLTAYGIYTGNFSGMGRALILYPWAFLMGALAYRQQTMEKLTIGEIEILQTRIGTYIFEAEGYFHDDGEEELLNKLYEKLERMKGG